MVPDQSLSRALSYILKVTSRVNGLAIEIKQEINDFDAQVACLWADKSDKKLI
ncbi:hypothetical protein [Pleionea sediminis]|uniref:hypothetical protein n=1 Tax=Pleionea sediminis TaxID=2569479 RepID=UPI0013DDCA36|nr:hypothetical protein [Pleionea sediminis]